MKILAICGPTASGKTKLAIEMAKALDGEIVSCDSMQVYKYMDIGTAKPSENERVIKHWMIDVIEPSEKFGLADYLKQADQAIEDIAGRNKLPIICGGTGLYMDSLISGVKLSNSEPDEEYRNKLFEMCKEKGNEELWNMLYERDKESAKSLHKNDTKRIIRALEVYHSTKIPLSEWNRISKPDKPKYDCCYIGLNYKNRQTLYDKINLRVDQMVADGLIEEAKKLKDTIGESTSFQAIGYKEIFEYLNGKCSYSEALEKLKQNTRNYAKRQLTWFKKNDKINWIYYEDFNNYEEIIKYSLNLWKIMDWHDNI